MASALPFRDRRVLAALFTAAGLISCARPQSPPLAAIGIQISEAEARSGVFSGEEEFADVAVVAPSFAGFYYSPPGSDTLVVAVADMADAGRAKEAVAALWLRRSRGPADQIIVRRVRYSFLQLHRWRRTVEPRLLSLPQVSMVDLDEGHNTVTVGVLPNTDRVAVQRLMRAAGLPRDAYRIVRFGPVRTFDPEIHTESSTPAK
jgi:hypothetical protein